MTEYRSTRRVYDLDDDGQPFSLRYAVGDVIDDDEAARQGLIPTPEKPEPEPKKRTPTTKVRTPATKTAAKEK